MLPINFSISGVSRTETAGDIRLNVKDDYRHLIYTQKPRSNQVPISFIGIPEPTSNDIKISDFNEASGDIEFLGNSFRIRVLRVQEGRSFSLPVKDALITDVTNTEQTGAPIPLFFRHTIPDGLETKPEILDIDMNPVPGKHYKVVVENAEINVFHNLESTIDPETLRVRAHFIRYTNTAGEQVFSLLNNTPAYSRANILDGANPDKRTYTVRRQANTFDYRIIFRSPGPFYIKIEEGHQIKLKKPLLIRGTEPWHLTIKDGEIFGVVGDNSELYHIPEYHLQNYSPVEPVKFSGTQECIPLTSNIVKAPFENILMDDNHEVEILVTDKGLNPKVAWTSGSTDPRRYWVDRFDQFREEGTVVRYPFSSLQVSGVSINNAAGLFHIPLILEEEDRVFIRAKYESKEYKYVGLNLNPLHTRALLNGRAIVYVIPDSMVNETRKSVYHIILDEDNNIAQWNDPRLGDGELIEALVPEEDETGFELFQTQFPLNLILGSIVVNRSATAAQMTYIDVRSRGGVLTDQIRYNLPTLLETHPELQWVDDDSWNARAFPALGSFVVDVPFSILEEAGGNLTREAVYSLVSKHMAAGSAPIINYYADTPKIVDMEYDTVLKTLDVSFRTVDYADAYRIYVSKRPDEGWMYVDKETSDGPVTDSLEVSIGFSGAATVDLTASPSNVLYVYIVGLKNGIEWPSGNIAKLLIEDNHATEIVEMNAILSSPPTASTTLNAIIVEE